MSLRSAIASALFRAGTGVMGQGYDAGESTRYREDLPWGRRTERDEDSALRDGSRDTIRMKGVDLKRNSGVVSGFCSRLAKFAVGADGISPRAKTTDKGWNRAAEEFFWETWGPLCDSRARTSLYRFQFQAMFLRPIHGGLYFEKLAGGQIRPIECERIRQPTKGDEAKNWIDGLKIDSTTGQVTAYWIHSRDKDGGFTGPHSEGPVDAANVLAVINPPWRPDQVREVPDLAHVVPLFQDFQEMNLDVLATAKMQSKISLWAKRNDPSSPLPSRSNANAAVGTRPQIKVDGMTILGLFPNEEVGGFDSTTPNVLHIPYMQWILTLCASAMDLPYEFLTLDFSKADWSRMKGILTFINQGMRPYRQWLIESMMRPLWCWRVAQEMGPGGELEGCPVDAQGRSEWDRVEWHEPEQIWVDRQEAAQSDVLEYQMGQVSLHDMAKRRGRDFLATLRDIAQEKMDIAAMEAEFKLPPGSLITTQIPGQTPAGTAPAKDPASPADDTPQKGTPDGTGK